MKTRKLTAVLLALIMAFAVLPAAAFAESIEGIAGEAAAMRKLDNAWAALDAAEADALAQGMSRTEVINAVYTAALSLNTVNKDSFSAFTKDGFYFTVDGMYCAYNYRLRNELNTDCAPVKEGVVLSKGSGKTEALRDAESADVFLIAPYYGHDSSFTDQYKREAQSVADATGGDYLLIQSTAATGPAIAENFPNKGVVFFDSHGTQDGTSSYLCLTTSSGITQEDYNNGWAVYAGSAAYIDGRYIEHHTPAPLSNCLVWMAICEGMKRSGQGTTGAALLRAGAGVVYGYSQSVTFAGDYVYEETFWNLMKDFENPATVAEAFAQMVEEHGICDPYGNAYPIVMSDVDAFPANPDSAQTVNSTWKLWGSFPLVDLTGFSLDITSADIKMAQTVNVNMSLVPENANNYITTWTSADESVAIVEPYAGSRCRAVITGMGRGETEITCSVSVNGSIIGTETVSVSVTPDETLAEAVNVEGGSLEFGTSAEYSFVPVAEGDRLIAKTNNAGMGNTTAVLLTTIRMAEGDTLSFDYFYSSETDYDHYYFKVNDVEYQKYADTNMTGFSSYTFTAPEAGLYHFEWSYVKDELTDGGSDCVKIDNVAFSGTGEPEEPQLSLIGITATVHDVRIGERIEVSFDCAPVACGGTIEPPAPELNEVAFTISADGVRFGDVATVSVDCAPVTAPQIAHRGRIEINFPTAFVAGGLGIYAELIPGELLERIEAAGGTYTLGINELEPIESTGHGRYPESIFVEFECAAGVEMSGNLFNYTATVSNTFGSETFPFEVELTIHSCSLTYIENGENYEVPVSANDSVFEVAPRLGDVNLDGSVTIADALEVMRHAIEVLTLEGASLEAADVNGDGVIGLPDAILIARIAMGL